MAIAKDIAIHNLGAGDGVENCIDYVLDKEKTDIEKSKGNVQGVLDYSENINKTLFALDGDENILVSGYQCSPETAALQFQMDRDLYHDIHGFKNLGKKIDPKTGEEVNKEEIVAHHIIQSFEYDKTLDPRLVHHLGQEFVQRAFPGCRAVISTHMNTDHLHNHIVISAFNTDGSGKIGMNMALRNQYRGINDDISLEYGLPILLETSQERTRKSYFEWMLEQNGSSWKESLKNDIKEAVQMAGSWEDYVEIMEGNGYEVNQRESFVTYTVPGALNKNGKFEDRKVRDKTLGKEYVKEFVEKNIKERMDHEKKVNHSPIPDKEKLHKDMRDSTPNRISIKINRYDNTGRRRSDLEMMILKAIKIIKHFMNKYWDPDRAAKFSSPSWFSPEKKLELMEETLKKVKEMEIETGSDLSERMNKIGIELSHTKKEMKDIEAVLDYSDRILDLINRAKELQKDLAVSKFDYNKLHIPTYSQSEIRMEKAKAMPMTSSQRRELYLAFQNNEEYVLTEKYDKLSYEDSKSCLDFLDGKGDKPEYVLSSDNTLEIKYKKMLDHERAASKFKLSKIPATDRQKEAVQKIADENEIVLDMKNLNKHQVMQILNCYSPNPFVSSPIVSGDMKQELDQELRKNRITISRPVTEKEAQGVIEYLRSDRKSEAPSVLKESTPIRQVFVNQIQELLELRNQACSVPLEQLSETDGYRLRDLLLYQGAEPDLQTETQSYTKEFLKEVKELPIEDSVKICEYRDTIKELAKLGITIGNMDNIQIEKENVINQYNQISHQEKELSKEYNNLKKLSYNLSLSSSCSFTVGPLGKGIEVDIEELSSREPDKEKNISKQDISQTH